MKDAVERSDYALETLLSELSELCLIERVATSLRYAAKLVEDAAYTYAHEVPGDQTVSLILISASLERKAKVVSGLDHSDK